MKKAFYRPGRRCLPDRLRREHFRSNRRLVQDP